uniref:Uncharacterized protein n=1 Tax=Glossina palpalis gambiensis TaxID=67801 RepID=A0A1B0BNU6_9MUSC
MLKFFIDLKELVLPKFDYMYFYYNSVNFGLALLPISPQIRVFTILVAYMSFYSPYRPHQPQFTRIPNAVRHPSLTATSSINPFQTIANCVNFPNHVLDGN